MFEISRIYQRVLLVQKEMWTPTYNSLNLKPVLSYLSVRGLKQGPQGLSIGLGEELNALMEFSWTAARGLLDVCSISTPALLPYYYYLTLLWLIICSYRYLIDVTVST